jgi:hypothetical protein
MKKILNIGIVGSRTRNTEHDKDLIRKTLIYFVNKNKNICIHLISGGCPKGADRFAEELANELSLGISIHYPDKSKLEDDTTWAYAKICYARNTLIAKGCNMLLAVVSPKRVGGTEDTIKKAKQLNKPVVLL